MKKFTTTPLALLATVSLFSSLIFSSCSDDDNDPVIEPETVLIPTEISNDESYTIKFAYDNNLRLTKIEMADESAVYPFVLLSYDSNGKVATYKNYMTEENTTFSYNKDTVFVSEQVTMNAYSYEHFYIIDDKGIPSKEQRLAAQDTTFLQYDSNNNLLQATRVTDYATDTIKSEYDSHKGIISNIDIPYWLAYYLGSRVGLEYYFYSKNNNLTRQTHYFTDATETTTMTYTINSDGLPQTISYEEDGDIISTNIKYTGVEKK